MNEKPWKLDTGSDGLDEILIGATADEIWSDVDHKLIESGRERPSHWTLRAIEADESAVDPLIESVVYPARRLTICWDSQQDPGWYVELQQRDEEGHWEVETHSEMAGFPVPVDIFDAEQREELIGVLREEFPGAEIVGE